QELGAPAEEVRQRAAPLVGLESIRLVDADPGQLLPPSRQLVAAPRELLLRLEQLEPRRQPLFTGPGRVCRHRLLSLREVSFAVRSVSIRWVLLVRYSSAGYRAAGVTTVAGFRWTRCSLPGGGAPPRVVPPAHR